MEALEILRKHADEIRAEFSLLSEEEKGIITFACITIEPVISEGECFMRYLITSKISIEK